jgi:glyoxylase-like metal-dependent hydrolase (beta-lactamase superfamily II)
MSTLPPVREFVTRSGLRIYRIPCQVFENLSARVYLVLGAGPPTLIDSGSGQGKSTAQILAGLETVRSEFGETVRPADIGRIIVTHGHLDHVGGLADLLPHMNAAVAVHPLDQRPLIACDEYAVLGNRRLDSFLQQAGVDADERARLVATSRFVRHRRRNVPVGILLSDGQELDGLRIIHTPGHSPGHVCIAAGDVLLSADHILARTLPQQWPESLTPYTGVGHYLDSLEKIERIDGLTMALAAHEPVIHDVYARIATIRASQQRRLERVFDLVRTSEAPPSIAEVTRRMYADAHGFRGVLALTDVGARVEYHHQRGRLAVANLDEVERKERPVYRYVVV